MNTLPERKAQTLKIVEAAFQLHNSWDKGPSARAYYQNLLLQILREAKILPSQDIPKTQNPSST
jgi:hypothetical protein